jgi:hypothetical protein
VSDATSAAATAAEVCGCTCETLDRVHLHGSIALTTTPDLRRAFDHGLPDTSPWIRAGSILSAGNETGVELGNHRCGAGTGARPPLRAAHRERDGRARAARTTFGRGQIVRRLGT